MVKEKLLFIELSICLSFLSFQRENVKRGEGKILLIIMDGWIQGEFEHFLKGGLGKKLKLELANVFSINNNQMLN